MRGYEIESRSSIKYFGLILDSKLSFKEHATKVAEKASRTTQNLARLMPNLGGLKSIKRGDCSRA